MSVLTLTREVVSIRQINLNAGNHTWSVNMTSLVNYFRRLITDRSLGLVRANLIPIPAFPSLRG